ncbi:C19orf54 isoform 9, partial [Pongo abelii]
PAPPHVFGLEKSQLLKEAFEKAGPVPKGREDVKRLLKLHKDRFRGDLRWILFCADLPSLIQEGPQCGLVALWMAGTLLSPPSGVPLERLMQVATERGYTAQGEMFSAPAMMRTSTMSRVRGRATRPTGRGCLSHLTRHLRNLLPGPSAAHRTGTLNCVSLSSPLLSPSFKAHLGAVTCASPS